MIQYVLEGWVLEGFGRDKSLVAEHTLHGVDAEEIREMVGAPDNRSMVGGGGYPLPDERVRWLERAAGLKLDSTRFNYSLVPEIRSTGSGPVVRPDLDSLSMAELEEMAHVDPSDDRAGEKFEYEIARRGLEQALPVAERLLAADAPWVRSRGAVILSLFLANSKVEHGRAEPGRVLLEVLEAESDPDVLASAIQGLGRAAERRALEPLVRLGGHEHWHVRWAVAIALPDVLRKTLDERGVQTLIELTADPVEDVRSWATEGFEEQLAELDTPAVRRALQERTEDKSVDVRCLALEALAIRGDIQALAEALRLCPVGVDRLRLAERLAIPELYEPLLARKTRIWQGDVEEVERAIAACRPKEEDTTLST